MASKKKTNKRKKISKATVVLLAVICFILGAALGCGANIYLKSPHYTYDIPAMQAPQTSVTGDGYSVQTITEKDLSIHFLELGNKYTGDCTLIKAGNTEVLIDAGSKTSSIPAIREYVDRYCTDGILEYVIVTHAHEDHYAGFATNTTTESIFDIYECETVITFSQITSGKEQQGMYKNFQRELEDEVKAGAKHYTAEECVQEKNGAKKTYDLGNGVELEILDSKFYYEASTTENNHSVCAMINQGTGNAAKHYLFTGDLEKEGEEELVKRNPSLPHVEVFKAGHHGSKTSTNDVLLAAIQPKTICVCCCAGSPEYTKTEANQFPTQDFVNRVSAYTSDVYVTGLCVDYKAGSFTSMNGNIAVCANTADQSATVYCSNNTVKLKDTDWFKNNRTCPAAWAA